MLPLGEGACPMTVPGPPAPSRETTKPRLTARKGGNLKLVASTPSDPGEDVDEAWIADLSDVARQIPGPIT